MRVLFLTRLDAELKPGGDGQLVTAYQDALRHEGCSVSVSHQLDVDYRHFDVVHLINLDSSLEASLHVRRIVALPHRPAIVMTPLHHQLRWVTRYYARCLGVPLGAPDSAAGLRYNAYLSLKEIARYLLIGRRKPALWPYFPHLVHSCYARKRFVLSRTDGVLVHADEEAAALWRDFGLEPRPHFIIPVGREEPSFAPVTHELPDDYILCVGRIEPLKNQLAILAASQQLGVRAVFVGALNRRHAGYCRRFLDGIRADPRHAFLGRVSSRESLNTVYRQARLHVLASWAEVWPLGNVEALSAGCHIATTFNSYEHELFGHAVAYCDPERMDSIADAISASLSASTPERIASLRQRIPSWSNVARSLLAAYRTAAELRVARRS